MVQSNLWGMETQKGCDSRGCRGVFNRIYEEWKLRKARAGVQTSKRFNRIYEEWKQLRVENKALLDSRSIESMRNGNLSRRRRKKTSVHGSIESMRNGNFFKMYWTVDGYHVQSNLWGMETAWWKCVRRWEKSSIESMRNGNTLASEGTNNGGGSSIESMRNGNRHNVDDIGLEAHVQSNLWGMETW